VARRAVVAPAAACRAALSCTYLYEEGPSENRAKVLRVALRGADYKSIQAAVDAAEPGVEIVVENGTYPAGDCPAVCSPCSFGASRSVLSSRMTA